MPGQVPHQEGASSPSLRPQRNKKETEEQKGPEKRSSIVMESSFALQIASTSLGLWCCTRGKKGEKGLQKKI